MAAAKDAVRGLVTGDHCVQKATAPHLDALFADKSSTRSSVYKIVIHHAGRKWSGGTVRGEIFEYAVVRANMRE